MMNTKSGWGKMKPNECKGCNNLTSSEYSGVGCKIGLHRTPNCPCQFCLVKVTCTKSSFDSCDKFNLHRTYYSRISG